MTERTERTMTERARQRPQARVIPLHTTRRAHLPSIEVSVHTSTRTIRPIEVVLLLPILVPFTIVVLLALLAWFVLWLAAVGILVVANLIGDIWRAGLCRLACAMLRSLDRRAISFQGH